nr:hypothetical protein [Rhodococcus pyridinivorans]
MSPQRRSPRPAPIGARRARTHPDPEAEFLIEFAHRWAPYGGPAQEEILVRFGMTTGRFLERLWQALSESNCVEDEIRRLASVYPRGQASGTAPVP